MKRDLLTKIIVRVMIWKGHFDVRSMHKNTKNARKKNEKLLFKILKTNQDCEYGKKYNFENIKSIDDYRKTVPITKFDDYEPYVTRMIENNEDKLITSLPLVGYAQSSGSVGKRKFVPLTQPEVNIYTKYTVTRMLALANKYHKEKNGKGLKAGRGIFTCPAFDQFLPNGLPCSNVADVAARQLGFVYPYILTVPFNKLFNSEEADSKYMNFRLGLEDPNLLYMFGIFFMNFTDLFKYLENNWETIVDDIETGTISDLGCASEETKAKLNKILKPNPKRAAELRKEFKKGFNSTILKRIWPNLSVICGIGTASFVPFAKIARKYTKGIPYDYSIYGASEGLYAAVDETEGKNMLLLVDSCYYEFIPVDDDDSNDNDKVFSLDEVEVGKEYEIIITNQSGLYRYKCGDVVKIMGFKNECPYVMFSYRKGQLLNLTGEKTTEEHMAEVVKRIKKKSKCNITNWSVYTNYDSYPYNYVLLLENNERKDLSEYSEFANKKLMEINPRFMVFYNEKELGDIEIKNLKYGTQEEWRKKQVKEKGTAITQYKPVRILDSDEKKEFFMSRIKNNKRD